MSQLPDQLRDAIVTAYAESLGYLIPFIVVALLLAITLKQIPLSDTAGMVARGEAVGGEEADRLEAEHLALLNGKSGKVSAAGHGASDIADDGDSGATKDDDDELVSQPR